MGGYTNSTKVYRKNHMIFSNFFPKNFGEDLGGVREDCDPLITIVVQFAEPRRSPGSSPPGEEPGSSPRFIGIYARPLIVVKLFGFSVTFSGSKTKV